MASAHLETDRQTRDGWINRQTNRRMEKQTDERTDGWMKGWTDRRMDGQIN
jgi:hypothetical protein